MKSIFLSGLLFLLLLTTIVVAQDEDSYDESLYTPAELQRNAQRKMLGMPPLPPKVMRKKASSTQTFTGYIAIHDDSVEGPLLGYLSSYKIVPDITEAVGYTYTTNGFLTEIMVAGSKLRLCVSTGLYGRDLGLGSKNFHMARHTLVSTAEGDMPFHDTKNALYLETTVFSIDPKTGEIEIEWVNTDGGRPPVQIALREERLYYTGDLSSFREYLGYDDTIKLVAYKWVPSEELGV